jgi:hypothetical protein
VILERSPRFDRHILQVRQGCLVGYWQSEKYFKPIANQLRSELKVKGPLGPEGENLLQAISQSEAVCLHVRRGDYISDPKVARILQPCSLDYYQGAVRLLSERLLAPYLFVFSDDPQWVSAHLKLEAPSALVSRPSLAVVEEFALMSACKHFIIANSSFSWWAAWLSSYPEKTVIAPRRWFSPADWDSQDLVPDTWFRL